MIVYNLAYYIYVLVFQLYYTLVISILTLFI
jgi:hypothetical protein